MTESVTIEHQKTVTNLLKAIKQSEITIQKPNKSKSK